MKIYAELIGNYKKLRIKSLYDNKIVSEIGACIATNTYVRSPKTRCLITAHAELQLDPTLDKCWTQLNYINSDTDGGLLKPLLVDQPRFKKCGVEERTSKVEKGWLSEIEGVIADKAKKIRGDRVDVLILEEFGSNPISKLSFIQGDALINVNGILIGIKLAWGTGGDTAGLSGLSDLFFNPIPYNILPMRHRYSRTGEMVLSGFFIPSYRIVTHTTLPGSLYPTEIMDHRGYTKISEGIDHYNRERQKLASDPEGYIIYCAEYCFIPEEALVLEGLNQFNRVLLVEQLAQLKLFHRGPKVEKGLLEYDFKGNSHSEENISGFKWLPSASSKLQIIERPLRDQSGKAYRNLYVAGIDSIDMGKSETSDETRDPSEFCIVIKRRAHGTKPPTYVAMYKDRPNNIQDAYRIALKLLEWYNCLAVIENSKINFRLFLEGKNKAAKYLMRRPRSTMASDNQGGSRLFGAPATEAVIQHQLLLIGQYIEEYSQEIWFEEMIEQLLHYSYENKRKFDIVASLGMCELADEELRGFIAKPVDEISSEWLDFGYYIDENGYKKFGIKPKEIILGTINIYNYDYLDRPLSSDPRKYY